MKLLFLQANFSFSASLITEHRHSLEGKNCFKTTRFLTSNMKHSILNNETQKCNIYQRSKALDVCLEGSEEVVKWCGRSHGSCKPKKVSYYLVRCCCLTPEVKAILLKEIGRSVWKGSSKDLQTGATRNHDGITWEEEPVWTCVFAGINQEATTHTDDPAVASCRLFGWRTCCQALSALIGWEEEEQRHDKAGVLGAEKQSR